MYVSAFKSVFETDYETKIENWFVEVENYGSTPEEDVKKSAEFLNAATFVK